jgi:hypothetical protein
MTTTGIPRRDRQTVTLCYLRKFAPQSVSCLLTQCHPVALISITNVTPCQIHLKTQDHSSHAFIYMAKQGGSSSDTSDVDSEGKGIEPRPRPRTSGWGCSCSCSLPPSQIGRDRSLPQLSSYRTMLQIIVWDTANVVK